MSHADAKPSPAKSVTTEKIKPRPTLCLKPSTKGAVSQPTDNKAGIKFPRCNAAVRKIEGGEWDLADAILAECSETGEDGIQNGSYAKMEEMRQEIATNHCVELSFERIRKLRKVASAFPPGRRRPAVSLEGHLEAGTPETLDTLVKAAPASTTLTRKYIQQQKHPEKKAEQEQQKTERRRQRR